VLETVVRLQDEDDDGAGGGGASGGEYAEGGEASHHGNGGGGPGGETAGEMAVLVDATNNLYVLAKPKDSTVPYEDVHLLMDVVKVLAAAWAAGTAVTYVGLPSIFGATMAGIVLGPSGLNTIRVRVGRAPPVMRLA